MRGTSGDPFATAPIERLLLFAVLGIGAASALALLVLVVLSVVQLMRLQRILRSTGVVKGEARNGLLNSPKRPAKRVSIRKQKTELDTDTSVALPRDTDEEEL